MRGTADWRKKAVVPIATRRQDSSRRWRRHPRCWRGRSSWPAGAAWRYWRARLRRWAEPPRLREVIERARGRWSPAIRGPSPSRCSRHGDGHLVVRRPAQSRATLGALGAGAGLGRGRSSRGDPTGLLQQAAGRPRDITRVGGRGRTRCSGPRPAAAKLPAIKAGRMSWRRGRKGGRESGIGGGVSATRPIRRSTKPIRFSARRAIHFQRPAGTSALASLRAGRAGPGSAKGEAIGSGTSQHRGPAPRMSGSRPGPACSTTASSSPGDGRTARPGPKPARPGRMGGAWLTEEQTHLR